MADRMKPPFYFALLLVIGALVWYGVTRVKEPAGDDPGGTFSQEELKNMQEAPDSQGVTTLKEYTFVPSARLPEVKGTSAYRPPANGVVRMALNVWAGWAPVIYANGGMKPAKTWKAPGGKDFKLELVLIDDPVAMRDAFASGSIHLGWATLDMLPLMIEGLRKDSRTMPRVYQQVDWSNGGDGIVVRSRIKSVADLRGKTCVLAQNSPSHYFLLNSLLGGGVQPSEVNMKFTQDAFQAAAAFNADKRIDCVVSWAPDIYNLEKVPGNRSLVTTQTANKLIADVWFARADFAKDNPEIIEGLVRGIFAGMEGLKSEANRHEVAKQMAEGYSIPETDAFGMLGDAHSTNFAENRAFFMDQNNPTNFERTWNNAYFLYKRINVITEKTSFDQIMDFSVIQKLASEPAFAASKDEYTVTFVPTTATAVQAENTEILTKSVVIQFFPNSDDIEKVIIGEDGKERAYDPNVAPVLEEIGRLSGQYGNSRIIIEGHTDASMRGRVDPAAVQELSLRRAAAVKQALLRKFKTLQANQFVTAGLGWDRPADPNDPGNFAKNRRVEVKVYPLEAPR